jgi:hypothetical protein
MSGRGPEEILRGHKKFLTSEGEGTENVLNMNVWWGGAKNKVYME